MATSINLQLIWKLMLWVYLDQPNYTFEDYQKYCSFPVKFVKVGPTCNNLFFSNYHCYHVFLFFSSIAIFFSSHSFSVFFFFFFYSFFFCFFFFFFFLLLSHIFVTLPFWSLVFFSIVIKIIKHEFLPLFIFASKSVHFGLPFTGNINLFELAFSFSWSTINVTFFFLVPEEEICCFLFL